MIIEEKMKQVRYVVDAQNPHIVVDSAICQNCSQKPCLYICPVQNYRLDEEGRVTFSWEACVECGACRIACTREALEWDYPDGSYGISYRYG